MADTDLNLYSTYNDRPRVAEHGWITGDAYAMVGHAKSTDANLYENATTEMTMTIDRYDLLFMYAEIGDRFILASNTGTTQHESVFAAFNGMKIMKPATFVGVATTAFIPHVDRGCKNQLVSFTMAGTVTVDCTSQVDFHAFDIVGWCHPVPSASSSASNIARDRERRSLRATLYPIKFDMDESCRATILTLLRSQVECVNTRLKEASRSNPILDILGLIMNEIDEFDDKCLVRGVYDKWTRGKNIDSTSMIQSLNLDLWGILEEMWATGPNPHKDEYGVNDRIAVDVMIMMYLACTKMISDTSHDAGYSVDDVKSNLDKDIACMMLHANILHVVMRFFHLLNVSRYEKQVRNVVGICLNEAKAGEASGLDILLKKHVI